MSLSPDKIKRIAHLARIAITEAEVEAVARPLNSVFGLIEQMQAVEEMRRTLREIRDLNKLDSH